MSRFTPSLHSNAKPLYLLNSGALGIDIDSTQRICIERQDKPPVRIPLHHISRIICNSAIQISSKSLIACLRNGIPLSVIDHDGRTLGWCLGVRRKESSLRQLLAHALDDPHWSQHYLPWLELQKAALAAHNLIMCGIPNTAAARQHPRVALCNAHFKKHQQACADHVNALAQLAQHELAATLAHESTDPERLAWHRPGLNLLQDLGDLIGLHAHTDIQHAPMLPPPEQIPNWAIPYYERKAAHWQQRQGQLITDFEQFLRRHWL
jgi:hypothetical protein